MAEDIEQGRYYTGQLQTRFRRIGM